MISLLDLLINTQTTEEVNTDEDQEESLVGFNKDILDNPHDAAAAANTVNEEDELKTETTQLDHSF